MYIIELFNEDTRVPQDCGPDFYVTREEAEREAVKLASLCSWVVSWNVREVDDA